jgi:hypothetical protein
MTTSKRYRVIAKNITYFYAYVEAESNEDARQIAQDMDGADFVSTEHGDWEIDEAILQVE